MGKNTEEYYLSRCREHIEAMLDRGAASQWTTYDFEKLSDAICERTLVRLSVTTLKRIWGRLKYESAPTLTTLNALAQFIGYADWRGFCLRQDDTGDAAAVVSPQQPVRKRKVQLIGLVCGVVIVIIIYFLFWAGRKQVTYDASQFEFSADKMITEGVPNSVIFHYTARVKPDSLFIVQTWDLSRKTLVPADKHEHSAIYYYPGFFKAKLIADGQIVKTHDLWITSGGWLCLLENDPVPVYFKKEQCQRDGFIAVDEAMLEPYRNSSVRQRVRFFNQRNLGELKSDNFTFETVVQNNFDDGTNACHYAQVLIQCKDDVIIIPLAAKSCVGDLRLYFCGVSAESKSADLSGFGCDLTQWTRLRVETVNRTATIFVNDVKAYTLTFPKKAADIVGIQYRFSGAAAVKEARFTAKGVVYEMN